MLRSHPPPPQSARWFIPLSRGEITLQAALAEFSGDGQSEIPWIVQLLENPRWALPWFDLFPGRVDLQTHDCIHALLGRGTLPADEAFVVGFTVGSVGPVRWLEQQIFLLIAQWVYPKPFGFGRVERDVYMGAMKLARSACPVDLSKVDYKSYAGWPLAKIRRHLGLDVRALARSYSAEALRYPERPECSRLSGTVAGETLPCREDHLEAAQ